MNGLYHGKGMAVYQGTCFIESDYKEGKLDGKGRQYTPSGELNYEGFYVAGNYEGQCKVYYEDGSKYEGAVRNKMANGIGVLTLPDGTIQCGQWEND